ncbi:MAG: hypothetical protein ACI9OJ_003788 [Myxococcota bacterium]
MASLRLAALAVLLTVQPAVGQSSSPSAVVFPASAAAAGLGDAFPLATGGADVLFYHPGALNLANGVTATFSAATKSGSLFSAAGAMDWFGGTVVVGMQNGTYGAAESGAGGLGQTEADLARGGPVTASESTLSVGYGHEVGPVLMGVTGRLLSVRAGNTADRGAALDLGAAFDAGFGVAALSVQTVGSGLELGADAVDLPTRVSLGVATRRRPLGPLDIMAAGAVDRLRGGDFRPGGGIELSYWPVQGRTFAGRIGYDHATPGDPASGLTLGGALMGDDFSLDYAWGRVNDDQSVHRISLGWR